MANDWMQIYQPQEVRDMERVCLLKDNFFYLNSGLWTDVSEGTATAAVSSSGTHGILQLQTQDTVDENIAGVRTTNAVFEHDPAEFALLSFGIRYRFAEANTNAANLWFGLFGDTTTLDDVLQDAGAGPYTTSHGAMGFYKVDGGTVWNVHSAVNSAGTNEASSLDAGTGSSWRTLYLNNTRYGATAVAYKGFYADGTENVRWPDPVRMLEDAGGDQCGTVHASIGATQKPMYLYLLLKSGSTTQETCYIDYVWAAQIRPADAISL